MAHRPKKNGGKGRWPGLLLQSLTRYELGSKNSEAPAATVAGSGDPYEFVDSQSLQPHSPETPRASGRPQSKTPPASKKLRKTPQSAPRKSPAETEEERLRRREKEEMKRALEESKSEAAKEERRRRRQRREQEAERVDQEMQTSSGGIEEAIGAVSSSQGLPEAPVLSVNSSAVVMESRADCSQSTPPLSGVPHSRLATPGCRTPVLQVRRLSRTLTPNREGGDRDATPVLSQEEGEKEGEEKAPENKYQEEGEVRGKRQSLQLSLRRTKKRLSGDLSSHESSPSSKKQRLESGGLSRQQPSPPPRDPAPLGATPRRPAAVRTGRRVGKPDRTDLPEMFAPEGVSPAAYAATILGVWESYVCQLREAQARVVSRVPWGKPIPSHQRQHLSSLTWHPALPRRGSSTRDRPTISHSLPAIDLETGEVVHPSPCPLSGSRSGSQRGRQGAGLADKEDEDFLSTPRSRQSGTPARPHRHRESERRRTGEKWFVPPPIGQLKLRPSPSRKAVSVPAHSTTPDPPPPSADKPLPSPVNSDLHEDDKTAEAAFNVTPPPSSVTVEMLSSSSSSAGATRSDTIGQSQATCEGEGEDSLPASGGGGEGEGTEGGGEGEQETERGGEDTAERAGDVASSTETGDHVVFRRQRKRARILEDSDSEPEGDSKSSSTNDVIPAKNSSEVLSGEGKTVSQSLFARSLASCGKRTKRDSASSKPRSVIDLTEEPTGRGEGEGEGEAVPCPLCSEQFPLSIIEAHAASCRGPESRGRRRVKDRLPLRQSSLLTPRFSRGRVTSPSAGGSGMVSPSSQREQLTGSAPGDGEGESEEQDADSSDAVSTTGGPVVMECEGGGYQVDPSTISSSPIRTFRRIIELDPQERAGYYNQFTSRGGRGRGGSWGRPGSSGVNSRRGSGLGRKGRGKRKFFRGKFRGRGRKTS